jgi:hypothetical protein
VSKGAFADAVRKAAREEAVKASPPPQRYRVVKVNPLVLEAFGSDLRLTEGDEDFEFHAGLKKKVRVGSVVTVLDDDKGDHMALDRLVGDSTQEDDPPSVSGSRNGNVALKNLLTALDAAGIIEDKTTA